MKYSVPPSWPDFVISCFIAKSVCTIFPKAYYRLLGLVTSALGFISSLASPEMSLATSKVFAAGPGVTSELGVRFPALLMAKSYAFILC